jgi:hypothetical protein
MDVLPSQKYLYDGAPSLHIAIMMHTYWLLQEEQLLNRGLLVKTTNE